ncbi:hypothetical protein F5J12DRAFT_831518 [Pisolithus orientalis]|uniref:uncharacterized protein n=1 Tax=Pisolithus orientalis TaxID=936130 RepID=UPI002224F089|nr:uncharacterized protein F5J12DRAFT_831518 [Pisolithus orientalis]KAI6006567.1 hypothetical protein F5J12DRAFT_831518 [Pisolithus orientalis]
MYVFLVPVCPSTCVFSISPFVPSYVLPERMQTRIWCIGYHIVWPPNGSTPSQAKKRVYQYRGIAAHLTIY